MSDAYDCIIYERIQRMAKLSIHSPEYHEQYSELLFFMKKNELEEEEKIQEKKAASLFVC